MKNIVFIIFLAFDIFAFENSDYYGQESYDEKGELVVLENPTQLNPSFKYAFYVKVRNIDMKKLKADSRIRVALWNNISNYASENITPYKASSFLASSHKNGEMTFKFLVNSLERLSVFIHFDINNKGKVKRNWLGIPKDPYMFSSAISNSGCPGIQREALSAPRFFNTLIPVFHNQIIEMCF